MRLGVRLYLWQESTTSDFGLQQVLITRKAVLLSAKIRSVCIETKRSIFLNTFYMPEAGKKLFVLIHNLSVTKRLELIESWEIILIPKLQS